MIGPGPANSSKIGALLVCLLLTLTACGDADPPAAGPAGGTGPAAHLLAAGDIADCHEPDDSATAALLAARPGVVAALGDTVYESGTAEEFRRCYAPTWGRVLSRTRPAAGGHEYENPETEEETGDARAYFAYFGKRAGNPGEGWYSYDHGTWHVVVLNSVCHRVGCEPDSPQLRWLEKDLSDTDRRCVLAYWHDPRFSSGTVHGDRESMGVFWDVLYRHRVEIVLNGHDHHYERFAPQTPDGEKADDGIREFVVGTGGRGHYRVGAPRPNSEVRDDTTFGILDLALREGGYSWRFVPTSSGSFTDAGSGSCR